MSTLAVPAVAVQASQPKLVSAVPAGFTPAINDGTVFAIAAVGADIVVGGSFTNASPPGSSTVYSLPHALAFDARTGTIQTGFAPKINGTVNAVIAGPAPHQVYVGGTFTQVDGQAMRVALLDTRTGKLVPSWHPSAISSSVNKLVLSEGRLYVGGAFTTVGGHAHGGLASLEPTTGKVTSYMGLSFTGHHNFGRLCDPSKTKCADGVPGVRGLDVDPSGSRMVVTGDFTNVSGNHRDQVAMVDLRKSRAVLDKSWATLAYTAECEGKAFDSYIREVQFSPNGQYFVIVASGGFGKNSDGTDSSCDAAARFQTAGHGHDIRPVWVAYTGSDSLWSVTITGTAVYVGGHQRWLNNTLGNDTPGPGAIPRPGLAALSPTSGLPLSWNPGRNPRGAGTYALLATSSGLWTGSDTNYIGNRHYLRPKLAFFPLAGGRSVPAESTPDLPGRVFEVGAASPSASNPDRLGFREFNGTAVGQQESVDNAGMSWGSVHGGFAVDGQLIYGQSDGNLYERSFNGSRLGSPVVLDPFNDPVWDNVQTGSGQTYQSSPSRFSAEIPNVTSMFFLAGRLYYTLAGQRSMRWRWFEPESGVVGATEHKVAGHFNWSGVAGAFYSRQRVYFASRSSGKLLSVSWPHQRAVGKARVVNAATDWASRGLFMLPQSDYPTPQPLAQFYTSCDVGGVCTQTATPWTDPAGGVVHYAWNWGDGHTTPFSTATLARHQYRIDGHHTITEIVRTTDGSIAFASYTINIQVPVKQIGLAGTTTKAGHGRAVTVKVPRQAGAGNALLLFDSVASSSVTPRTPKGWHVVGRTRRAGLTTTVYRRLARRHDPGSRVTLKYSHRVSSSAILAAYRNASVEPIEASAAAVAGTTRSHQPPALRDLRRGTLAVVYCTQTSRKRTKWSVPTGLHRRAKVSDRHRHTVGAMLADSGAAVTGAFSPRPVGSSRPSAAAAQWTVALAPAFSSHG